ncbi:MAG: cytochrome c oxidase subunit 3 [Ginsengibacter sp.]
MLTVVNDQKGRLHPHKFALWIALGSIVMMFAGLSSAYIVKRNQANWLTFDLPVIFWYSTAVIIISSITIMITRNAFLTREMQNYKRWLLVTTLLGISFVFMQYIGFTELWKSGITLTRNVSFSFLFVIVGLHAVHIIGGVIALIILLLKSFSSKTKNYSSISIDLMNTYWHFVDFLWIYILIFLVMIK